MSTPSIVISIDFELRWGVAAKLPDDASAYRRNLVGARDAVVGMIELFEQRRIGATWATVGALACNDWDEYYDLAPPPPHYAKTHLGVRPAWRQLDPRGELHFAPDLVGMIAAAPHQELGSHTFSHIYFMEDGCTSDDVGRDATAIRALFENRFDVTPTSLVFPRNQIGFEAELLRAGIRRWRRNPTSRAWRARPSGENSQLVRAGRLVDALLPIRTGCYPADGMQASHLVRFNLGDSLWNMHANRIARDAAKLRDDETLHIWWHPHNLGADVEGSLARLRQLIDRISAAAPERAEWRTMQRAAGELAMAA